MKLQNLAIIFLVVTLPLVAILSYYLNLQHKTLKMQADYDMKLAEATKEGIKSFEVNTVDWSEWVSQKGTQKARENVQASINTFINSLANNLHLSGTAKEYMANYIPAVAATMYDGYYIYAPTYVPITANNDDGVQLFYDNTSAGTNQITLSDTGETLYQAKTNGKTYYFTYEDDQGNTQQKVYNDLTTNISDAKTEYRSILNNKIAYAARYQGANTSVVVNYTLDNRIYVYGKVDGEYVDKTGYLIYTDSNSLPRAYTNTATPKNDSSILVSKSFKGMNADDTSIETEILEEQILYSENGQYILKTFKYIYDITHEKLYYDGVSDNFFTVDPSSKQRRFIENSDSVTLNSNNCKYKSISILWGNSDGTTEYKKIYQVLNGKDKGKWCISLKPENSKEVNGIEVIDTILKEQKLKELGLDDIRFTTLYRDFSAISYYTEAYAFTNWVKQKLGTKTLEQVQKKADNDLIDKIPLTNNIFKISATNDPEDENSDIVIHKKEIMRDSIITNLNLAISNHNAIGQTNGMPKLTDSDWDRAFSNISLITFFQGPKIGLKIYNGYAVATSTINREYVEPGELYFRGEDVNYHRVYCQKCGKIIYTGYRSVEYVQKEFTKAGNTIYYYQHDNSEDTYSETSCYYCIVNKANYEQTHNPEIAYLQKKSYNEALARERYYQLEELTAKLYDTIKISVTKKKISINNTDLIFILDDSGSMTSNYDKVKNSCYEILDAMIGTGLSSDFYIGFVRFGTDSEIIGSIRNSYTYELNRIKDEIAQKYGKGGGTYYNKAFITTQQLIRSDLGIGFNDRYRVIIFMTDGNPHDAGIDELRKLRDVYNVKGLYLIRFGNEPINILKEMKDMFIPNSELLSADASNLTDTFKDILYRINESKPEEVETVNGRLDISDIEVSAQKPMTVTVRNAGGALIKQIVITTRPTASSGIIIIDGTNMYLSLDGLKDACGITDFNGIKVSIEYFTS